jgi:membrane-associated phospholipid phosphatase
MRSARFAATNSAAAAFAALLRVPGLNDRSSPSLSTIERRLQVGRCVTALQHPAAYGQVIDWTLFHAVNAEVATHDWLEDPVTALARVLVPLYAVATVALWLLARPYGNARWKLACVSALVSAGLALGVNQVISHVWERARPFTEHPALTHVLSARTTDPSFPSDHASAAFAIAFAVLAFSRRGGALFLAGATLVGLSRIALGVHYPSDVLAGALVGYLAAVLVTTLGRPWVVRAVVLLSRITDPLLRPVWHRCRRLLPASRSWPADD